MSTAQSMSTENSIMGQDDSDAEQYLTFVLAGEEYGVDILRVQEIKGWDAVTKIPNTPTYIRGVINLRGTIVPIIDMRLRFNLEQMDYGPTTVVIVLKVESGEQSRTMGIVVDGVSDTYNIPEDAVKAAPDFGASVDTDFVKGLATIEEKMVIILNIDKMLNSRELATIDSIAE